MLTFVRDLLGATLMALGSAVMTHRQRWAVNELIVRQSAPRGTRMSQHADEVVPKGWRAVGYDGEMRIIERVG